MQISRHMRKTLPAKVTAVGFILLVLFGNLWLTYSIMNIDIPEWMKLGFMSGFILAIVGGVGIILYLVLRMVYPDLVEEDVLTDQPAEEE